MKPANANASTHGAYGEQGLKAVSTREKRAFLKAKGVRLSELDQIGVARLDQFARMQAKVVLLDAYLEQHGLLAENGEPRPAAKLYPTIHNSAQRALDRLESWLLGWQAAEIAKRNDDPFGLYRVVEAEAEER